MTEEELINKSRIVYQGGGYTFIAYPSDIWKEYMDSIIEQSKNKNNDK